MFNIGDLVHIINQPRDSTIKNKALAIVIDDDTGQMGENWRRVREQISGKIHVMGVSNLKYPKGMEKKVLDKRAEIGDNTGSTAGDQMPRKTWTRRQIINLLKTRNSAVEKGIVRIYQLQTRDEQKAKTTRHRNNVGFNASDAKRGTKCATWVMSGKHLTGWHLDKARDLCIKYSGQLTDIANGNL
jgi:hypothetical protein